jgi:hypothetical protein
VNDKIKYMVEIWLRQSENLTVDTMMLSELLGKGFGVNSLEQMRIKGVGPPFTKGNGIRSPVVYNLIDIAEWLESQKRKTV